MQAEEKQHEPQRRSRPTFRPVLLEVAGSLNDDLCVAAVRRLRQERSRYAPILRLTATLISPAVAEVDIFGCSLDNNNNNNNNSNNISGALKREKRPRVEPLISAPSAAILAEGRIEIVHRLHDLTAGVGALGKLDTFMSYHFLPLALMHNTRPDISPAGIPFILRHYVHEATRTSSFLVADTGGHAAVVIDPQGDTSPYEADLARLQLRLHGVILTHCFVDVAMGHAALLQRHAGAVLITGGTGGEGSWPTVSLGVRLHLRCVPLPSFSPECMLVELHLDSALLAVFTGTVLGTDAAPRYDFFADFPGPTAENSDNSDNASGTVKMTTSEVISTTQRFLKERLWDRYFAPTCGENNSQSLDHVVVFPSHGGYNNVTHQLDLYWAAHIGDLKRMKHSRKVLDTFMDVKDYTTHVQGRPPLPKTLLFSHVREYNLCLVPSAFGGSGAKLIARRSLPRPLSVCSSTNPTHHYENSNNTTITTTTTNNNNTTNNTNNNDNIGNFKITPLLLDIRDTAEHEMMHLKGSVNIPMKFPANAYGVKKAELWLQCTLRPLQPIVVICASEEQVPLVRRRLELISPGAPIEVFTAKELEMPSFHPAGHTSSSAARVGIHEKEENEREKEKDDDGCITRRLLPRSVVSSYLPRQLVWVTEAAMYAFSRIDSYQQLQCIEPREDTMILDCRTSYEFRNGSHKHSVHVSLADLCEITARDTSHAPSSSNNDNYKGEMEIAEFCAPSRKLGEVYLEKLYESAILCGIKCRYHCENIKKIIIYCASGYRSIIAASLLRRAFEAAAVRIQVHDVAGGALQIMKQRPDLWAVKDRSIICVS